MSKKTLFAVTAIIVWILDRVTKLWALKYLSNGDISVMPGVQLSLAYNTGMSFSLFAQTGADNALILFGISLSVTVALLFIWKYFCSDRWYATLAYGAIIGGGLGNLYDRLIYRAVIDFIDLYYKTIHWPTFNLADAALVCGFCLLMGESFYETTT